MWRKHYRRRALSPTTPGAVAWKEKLEKVKFYASSDKPNKVSLSLMVIYEGILRRASL